MPATLVQAAGAPGTSTPFVSNVTLGNLLVVAAASLDTSGAVTFAVSDTQGNVYTPLPLADANPAGGGRTQIFYAIAKSSAACTVTLTSNSLTPQLIIHEFTTMKVKDKVASASGTGAAQDSGPVTTVVAAEVLFSISVHVATSLTTVTPGAGWTQAIALTPTPNVVTQYQVVAATGTYDATSTSAGGKSFTDTWLMQIATFAASLPLDTAHKMTTMGVGG